MIDYLGTLMHFERGFEVSGSSPVSGLGGRWPQTVQPEADERRLTGRLLTKGQRHGQQLLPLTTQAKTHA